MQINISIYVYIDILFAHINILSARFESLTFWFLWKSPVDIPIINADIGRLLQRFFRRYL